MSGKGTEAGRDERKSTYYNKYNTYIMLEKVHKIVKFAANIRNFSLFTFHFSLFFVPLHPQIAKITFI